MKYLVVFSCLLVVAYGLPPEILQTIKDTLTHFCEECRTETGATDDDIAPIKAQQPATTQTGKCFMACMNKKLGFQDASGKIDKAGTLAQIEKLKPFDEELYGKMKQVVDVCLTEVSDGADECETAHNMMACVHKENQKVGMKPMDF